MRSRIRVVLTACFIVSVLIAAWTPGAVAERGAPTPAAAPAPGPRDPGLARARALVAERDADRQRVLSAQRRVTGDLHQSNAVGSYQGADALGDSDPFDTRSDIGAFAIYYDTGTLTLSFKTAYQTNPGLDPIWDPGITHALHDIDVNGDGLSDFAVFYQRDWLGDHALQAEIRRSSDLQLLCTGDATWSEPTGYTVKFYPGCMGGFGPVRVNFYINVDRNPYGSDADFSTDFAPGPGAYTPFVDAAPAPPPPPPPPPPPLPTRAVQAHGYVLDGYGGLWPYREGSGSTPRAHGGPYWPGWNIARGVAYDHVKGRGLVVDAFGGLHPFTTTGTAANARGGGYWPGWDIVRGVALTPDGRGGVVLDAFGGMHPFALGRSGVAPTVSGGPYWPGQDIARGVAILPDGTGGYVVDGLGGLHAFRVNGSAKPPRARFAAEFGGRDLTRGVGTLADRSGGLTVDAFGGLHGFNIGTAHGNVIPRGPVGSGYWPGWDIVRGVTTY